MVPQAAASRVRYTCLCGPVRLKRGPLAGPWTDHSELYQRMSDQTAFYVLLSLFFFPTVGVATFVLVRQKRRRDWAWHRLVDYAERRTEASFGLPKNANDALVALFEAAAAGDLYRLKDTRTLAVPVDARDGVGQTALLVASNRKSSVGVGWRLKQGADVNAADALGETALLKASRVGAHDLVELLLQSGALTECRHVEGWTPLVSAALNGHESIVRLLLASGADRSATFHGKTALILAQQQGHKQIAALLNEPRPAG